MKYLLKYSICLMPLLFSCCSSEKSKENEQVNTPTGKQLSATDDTTNNMKEATVKNPVVEKIESKQKRHYGIDVSHFQGDLLEDIKHFDSLSFVICKATQGTQYIDPMFRTNWRTLRERGVMRGAYHFYDCGEDPKKQARHFCSQIEDFGEYDISPVLDIEQGSMKTGVSAEEMQENILVFLQTVNQILNRKPILYTDYAFAQQYFSNDSLADFELWLAEYTSHKAPKIPTLWKNKGFLIWQRSSSYHRDSELVDLDLVKGSLKELLTEQ